MRRERHVSMLAGREALALSKGEQELALCSNACLLALAWSKGGKPLYASGGGLLRDCSVSNIRRMAKKFADFERVENPSIEEEEEKVEAIKKAWSTRMRSAFAGVCSGRLARSLRRNGQRP